VGVKTEKVQLYKRDKAKKATKKPVLVAKVNI
jgi:hypothetical protein